MPLVSSARQSLDYVNDECFDAIYLAAVESVEEAVVNALVAAGDTPTLRPPGKTCRAIDHDALIDVMRRYGRCG
jgi:D-aminopeptidase